MKIVIGNVLFGLLVWGWYYFVDANMEQFKSGALFAFLAFLIGTGMGYWLNVSDRPARARRSGARGQAAAPAANPFDQIVD